MLKKFFEKEGYAIIQNAINQSDLNQLSDACNIYDYGDLLSYPVFDKFVLNKKLLSTLKQILGCTPIYFGDLGALIGPRLRGLHRDLKNKETLVSEDKLIRAGLYIRPSGFRSGGLKVVPRSHRSSCNIFRNFFLSKNLYPNNGDIIIWDARLLHSGSALCFASLNYSFHPIIEDLIKPIKHSKIQDRTVLLSTYSKPGNLYKIYKRERSSSHMEEHWRKSFKWTNITKKAIKVSKISIDTILKKKIERNNKKKQ